MNKNIINYFVLAFLCLTCRLFAVAEIGTPDRDDIEYPDDEEPTEAEIELGKVLYFDERLSKNRNISCATCHSPELGFGDGVAGSIGTNGNIVHRNTPHIYNLAWNSIFMWDGRLPTLEAQALGPMQAEGEMNMSLDQVVDRLEEVDWYKKKFAEVYDDGITAENAGKAIAAFERTVISDNSPFDKYIAGDKAAMDPAAIRGMEVFKGKGRCIECHNGPNFTDESFHNLGVSDDIGRGAIAGGEVMNGAFKTPGLRNVLLTAPYMHDGSLGSLEEVIRFYSKGGGKNKYKKSGEIKKLDLTEQEIYDLVAFMGALTDPVDIERPEIP